MDYTPEQLAQNDPAYWAYMSGIKLQSGPFTLKDHEYQREPMSCKDRRICWMKATQGGVTEMEILRSAHGLIYRRYPLGVLYIFPTTDIVREFGKSRWNPLIQSNHRAIGRFVKTGGKGSDSVSLKKFHDAFLFLRGASLTQKVGIGATEKESASLRGISVDKVVFDEMDLMDPQAIEKALGRMGASSIKEEVYISNPTLEDRGIHEVFQKSDQRYLHLKCSCGHYTCAALEFPECVRLRDDKTGYLFCKKCEKEITNRTDGIWVPEAKDNTDYMKGYHWSQLNSMSNDPGEMLLKYNDPPLGNMGDVVRLKLGFPYTSAEDRLTASVVYACCNNDMMQVSSPGPCAMGVDVGKLKHIVIGQRVDRERFQIVRVAIVEKWEDIHDLAQRFNVKSAVIDIRPYEDSARAFQKSEPYKSFLCEYTENPVIDCAYDTKKGMVKVFRTGVFDRTHRLFADQMITIPRKSPSIETYVKQMCGCAKVLEVNQRNGTSVYRYRTCGPHGDHYRNATNYFWLAAKSGRLAQTGIRKKRQEVAINDAALV